MTTWKDVNGFEGLYEVSEEGAIRSIEKVLPLPKGGYYTLSSRTLRTDIARGYARASIYKNGIKTRMQVHRIVATAFIDNPDKKPCINHKDFNRLNNSVSNLEWCTHKENSVYSSSRGRFGKSHSDTTKQKMRIAATGRVKSIESILKGKETCMRKKLLKAMKHAS